MAKALPLQGIRVANFGWVWAGPVVGQPLGFLGAEVYKIESRARIDLTRMLPPFGEGVRDPDRSLSNHAAWAGNGSVPLNLKKPRARELALQLIGRCDVVVENFGPGVMNNLELGYRQLREVKPDIILFSMPAAGLDGPLKDLRTYGLSLASTTGLDSLTGYAGGPPVPVENAFCDPFNGIMGAFAILTALTYRDRTGKGQHIDALHEHLAAWTSNFNDYDLAERLQRHGVAAAPVLNVADLLNDPHYRARGTFIEVQHPLGFRETIYGAYVKTSRTEAKVRPGPRIGQDNDFVFKTLLELPDERYRQLIDEQVIY